ncbi:MAG TPA: mechanosensitive ion channel family protein [Dehalococcoidia bacterium]|nr:mechanosensitive ion channel family protein [Dehalococcoidia bacterium]
MLITFDDAFRDDAIDSTLRVLLVLVVAFVGVWLLQRLINPLIRVAIREQMSTEPEIEVTKRIETLSLVIYRTALVAVLLIVVVTTLPEFGINVAPMVAGLGLVGLAVGFGAQGLVKDIINGGFILIENQYGRNDVVTIAGVTGLVEDINLRRTILRDLDGTVHFVSHSQIGVASNWTKGFSRVNLNIAIAYEADIDRAIEVINRVGKELAEEEAFVEKIKVPPHVLRVDALSDTGIELKVVGDTAPIEQWTVMGELRLRLKKAFDAEGIVMPSAARAMQMATAAALAQDAARGQS